MDDYKKKLYHIEAIIMDVDGVLTDGRIILGSGDIELKSFHVRDGMAINIAQMAGLKIGFLSGRTSDIVSRRGEELKVDYLFQGVRDKLVKLQELTLLENLSLENICYIGDDISDIPVLKQVGFPATVLDAPDEVKSVVSYISKNRGGMEAVRDVIQLILKSQGKWDKTLHKIIKIMEKGNSE